MRAGTFSSSNIYKLMTNGKKAGEVGAPFKTYVKETQLEMRLGRALTTEGSTRPALWGTFVEAYVHDNHIGLNWELCSQDRLAHSYIPNWTGAPDLLDLEGDTVGDIKCPAIKNFCELSDICAIGDVFELRKSYPEYFWQLVSNACLTDVQHAELIVFCPYQHELQAIKDLAVAVADKRFLWIGYADDSELPYLIEGRHYKNVARMRFLVTEEMETELTERVKLAVKQLGVSEYATQD